MEFQTLKIDLQDHLAWLRLNRPDKANAFSLTMWEELPRAVAWLNEQSAVRVVILCGEGRHFTAGIDMEALMHLGQMVGNKGCAARARENLRNFILSAQDCFSSLERLRVPVIAAVHGACIGAGVDLIAACDLRYCTADAKFSIKEVDLAVTADVGTLQRLRHVIGLARLSELSYTGDTFDGHKALDMGLVGAAYASREELMDHATQLAHRIAAKSPVTVRGIKHNLLYSRDHSVRDGLEMVATWNAAMLVSDDLGEALAAYMQKREPRFAD
ncbi:MAG: crotonase/enoyl-CoA hydratase family protein [Nevskia sp.]|nr:crotonase/enoyl-CoA hydratase family protein [Nevskia sp.]